MFNHGLGGWLFSRVPTANDVFRPKTKGRLARIVHSGSTFNAGRNAEKRKASEAQHKFRRGDVESHADLVGTWADQMRPAPKRNCDVRMHMLANRRLRQRGVRS